MFALGEPLHTPYDIRFKLFGCQVRVAATFWLVAALLGWDSASWVDRTYLAAGGDTPGMAILLLIWMIAMLLSILIHELGHYLAFRFFGIDSHIVLYHFGGLAIPSGARSWVRSSSSSSKLTPFRQLIISAAGPLAQLTLAVVVAVVAVSMGLSVGSLGRWFAAIGWDVPKGAMPRSAAVYAMVDFLVFPSVFWALFNLLPVLPLDGGKIAEELIRLCFGGTQREALLLSIIVAAAVALWGFKTGNVFLAIFFVSFAFNNYEMLQSGGMRRPW